MCISQKGCRDLKRAIRDLLRLCSDSCSKTSSVNNLNYSFLILEHSGFVLRWVPSGGALVLTTTGFNAGSRSKASPWGSRRVSRTFGTAPGPPTPGGPLAPGIRGAPAVLSRSPSTTTPFRRSAQCDNGYGLQTV